MLANRSIATAQNSTSGSDDIVTVAAIGILAFISTDLAHEVVGHGIGLLIAGGRSGILTTTRLIHEPHLPSPGWRIFDIGGPAGNLIWAGLCFLAQRQIGRAVLALKLFLWATMSFSLSWEFGYLIKCGLTGQGDAMALTNGLTPGWLWRSLMFLVGVALYRWALRFISAEIHFVLSTNVAQWRSRLVRLLTTLCGAGGLIACAGPFFDPRGRLEMLNSGALTSFAAWVGLLAVPSFFPLQADKDPIAVGFVGRSIPLILLAAVASVLFVGVLGPGISFSW